MKEINLNWKGYFKEKQEEMVHLLESLVNLESPSQDKKSVDRCSSFLLNELNRIGLQTKVHPQVETGDIITAEYPQEKASEQILLLTHIDTVWPVGTIKKMPFSIKEDKIFGPGVLDMKAGLVQAVFAIKGLLIKDLLPGKKITLFVNSAEEIGSESSYRLIKDLAEASSAVFCLEPALPGGGLKLKRKGRLVFEVETRGKAAHAGTPEKGLNAIEELVLQLHQLRRIRTKSISLNMGTIQGGTKANVVAEQALTVIDIRFWKKIEQDNLLQKFQHIKPILPGASISFSLKSLTPPMEKNPASTSLFNKVKKIASLAGIKIWAGKSGGGSDASVASQAGAAVLDGLGPEGEGIHAENEHLLLSSLIERTALLAEILQKL
ncbi:MAG: M20 family metallopeptidase [Acidobacteriota bacterium]